MKNVLLAPLTKLIQLQAVFQRFFIFAGKIINPLALRTL
jgi:hypothetical protein